MSTGMATGEEGQAQISGEEQDNHLRRNKKVRSVPYGLDLDRSIDDGGIKETKGRRKYSFRDLVIGVQRNTLMQDGYEDEDANGSKDDIMEDKEEGPWFIMWMTKEEKKQARKPWKLE